MIGTVFELIEAGKIKQRRRTTADDLEFAATWLEAYEGDPEDDRENLTSLAAVALLLRNMAARRANHR